MNTTMTSEEEEALRRHFALKVRPQYKPSTIDKIVAKINAIRVGEASIEDWINPTTKILNWDCMIEQFGLYGKFVAFP
jgi:hypothetical protein